MKDFVDILQWINERKSDILNPEKSPYLVGKTMEDLIETGHEFDERAQVELQLLDELEVFIRE